MENSEPLYTIVTLPSFERWLKKLRNRIAKAQILDRLTRIETEGFFGDTEGVGDGVSELRFHVGAGYRVYYTINGNTIVILLCAGDKSTQQDDIKKAKALLKELDNEND